MASGLSPTEDPLAVDAGRLVHRVLERVALEGLPIWPVARVHALCADWAAWLVSRGHEPDAARSRAAMCVAGVTGVLEDASLRWVLEPHAEARSEWALVAEGDASGPQHHVLDRSFLRHGERWIVDFKLGSAPEHTGGSEFQPVWPEHAEQLRRYADLFRSEGVPLRLAVLYLGSGRLVELDQ